MKKLAQALQSWTACVSAQLVIYRAREVDCFEEVPVLLSDHLRQVPLYNHW